MAHALLLQDYVTIRSSAQTDIYQQQADYLDMTPYQDFTAIIDIRQVDTNIPTFNIETSPSLDEVLFKVCYSHVGSAAATPLVGQVNFSSASVPLARWLRWHLSGTTMFGATFRIWILGNTGGAA